MGISVLQWNANGLLAKQNELKQHVAKNEYDVICIQETFLKPDKVFDISGYESIRKDRETAKGGLLILLRHGIKYITLPNPQNIEAQIVEISTMIGKLKIINVYVAPNAGIDIAKYQPLFTQPNTIILGDMNAKSSLWNARTENDHCRAIETLVARNNYVVLNTGLPTFQNSRGQTSHIDLTLTSNNLGMKCNWYRLNNAMASDHLPIVIQINGAVDTEVATITRWNLTKADWSQFQQGCEHYVCVSSSVCQPDVDMFNDNIIDMINTAAVGSITRKRVGGKRKKKALPYWNDRIKSTVYERNRARNKMMRAKTEENIHRFKQLKGIAQHVIKESAQSYWREYCETLNSSTRLNSVWNMAKRMNGIQPNVSNKHLVNCSGETVDKNADKAELLAQQFAAISSSSNYSEKFQRRKHELESQTNLLNNDAKVDDRNIHLNLPFTEHELKQALSQTRRNTSPGEDGIPYECLKRLPGVGRRLLLKLYNVIWETGKIPTQWKHAVVLPLPKAGKNPHDPNSYRPISLTSTLCKVMERLVANRLTWYLEKYQLLSNVQTGFRKNHSTIDQIIRLQDIINRNLPNHSHTVGIFLDFEKAFDMM